MNVALHQSPGDERYGLVIRMSDLAANESARSALLDGPAQAAIARTLNDEALVLARGEAVREPWADVDRLAAVTDQLIRDMSLAVDGEEPYVAEDRRVVKTSSQRNRGESQIALLDERIVATSSAPAVGRQAVLICVGVHYRDLQAYALVLKFERKE